MYVFRSNLDAVQGDIHAMNTDLISDRTRNEMSGEFVPAVGDIIVVEFSTSQGELSYELEVVSRRFCVKRKKITVELHIPRYHMCQTIADWEKWFKRHRS